MGLTPSPKVRVCGDFSNHFPTRYPYVINEWPLTSDLYPELTHHIDTYFFKIHLNIVGILTDPVAHTRIELKTVTEMTRVRDQHRKCIKGNQRKTILGIIDTIALSPAMTYQLEYNIIGSTSLSQCVLHNMGIFRLLPDPQVVVVFFMPI